MYGGRSPFMPVANPSRGAKIAGILGAGIGAASAAGAPFAMADQQRRIVAERDKRLHEFNTQSTKLQTDENIRQYEAQSNIETDAYKDRTPDVLDRQQGVTDIQTAGAKELADHQFDLQSLRDDDQFTKKLLQMDITFKKEDEVWQRSVDREDEMLKKQETLMALQNEIKKIEASHEIAGDRFDKQLDFLTFLTSQVGTKPILTEGGRPSGAETPVYRFEMLNIDPKKIAVLAKEAQTNPSSFGSLFGGSAPKREPKRSTPPRSTSPFVPPGFQSNYSMRP